jgi:hypothetical protein
MALEPFFSLSAAKPYVNTYNSANPTAPYCRAYLYQFGMVSMYPSSWRLSAQLNNDELIMGYDAVPLADQNLYSEGHPYKQCVTRIYFHVYNVTTENQFLLMSQLRGIQGTPTAQFFVGSDLVDTEEILGIEQHAILMECPSGPTASISTYIRLASPSWSAAMALKGIDCYLL